MGLLTFDKFLQNITFVLLLHVNILLLVQEDGSNFVLVKLENVPTIHLFFMLARRDGISLFSILLPSLFHHLITNCQETHSLLHSNCDYKVRIAD